MTDDIKKQHIEYILRNCTAARRAKILREMLPAESLRNTWAPNAVSVPVKRDGEQSPGIRTADAEQVEKWIEQIRKSCWCSQHNACTKPKGGKNEHTN